MTIQTLSGTKSAPQPCAATVGFFDGVHRGHQCLLEQLRTLAAARGLPAMAVTFDRHPRQVLHSEWQPSLLTTLAEKEELLALTGIDMLTVVPFTTDLSRLTAHQFMQQVLLEQLGVRLLLTGYDHHFGHRAADSTEGAEQYAAYGREMGMEVVCGQPLVLSELPTDSSSQAGQQYVSSSLVRRLLDEGRVDAAARCLGRCYRLTGIVGHGRQEGRRMGFPTANLVLSDPCRLVPRSGVYAVEVTLAGEGRRLAGMTNIGTRPTFDGHEQTVETHILGYSGDLYGQTICLDFHRRLRDERPFSSPAELARQMAADAYEVEQIMSC